VGALSCSTNRSNVGPTRPVTESARQQLRRGSVIFTQGGLATTVYYIERGRVQLTTLSAAGEEATVAILKRGMFFGETCLVIDNERLFTARALSDCTLVPIDKRELNSLLHRQPDSPLVRCFLRYLIERSYDFERHMLDQIFDSCELRLARVLLMLAYANRDLRKERTIEGLTHEMLAGLTGTTRARVTVFMAKFRRLNLIDYSRKEIVVRPALRTVLRGLTTATSVPRALIRPHSLPPAPTGSDFYRQHKLANNASAA